MQHEAGHCTPHMRMTQCRQVGVLVHCAWAISAGLLQGSSSVTKSLKLQPASYNMDAILKKTTFVMNA